MKYSSWFIKKLNREIPRFIKLSQGAPRTKIEPGSFSVKTEPESLKKDAPPHPSYVLHQILKSEHQNLDIFEKNSIFLLLIGHLASLFLFYNLISTLEVQNLISF